MRRPFPLDTRIHQPSRMRIMALLFRNRSAAFVWVRETLGMTDGNLYQHAVQLEKAGFVRRHFAFTARGFQLRISITSEGDAAFRAYLAALKDYLVLDPASTNERTPRLRAG
ncbi:MAG: transcriptional regulator [Thermoplasmata archaeon]|nr:transcriptional regulator [Thermoplasmata archaeon]